MGTFFPESGHSATQTELKVKWTDMMLNITEILTTKRAKVNHLRTTALEQSVIINWFGVGHKLVLRAQLHPQYLMGTTYSVGSHDNPLTR